MKFESNQKENDVIPVAFIDEEGDLWFRTNHEEDIMQNKVSIIDAITNQTLTYCDMNDFVTCANNDETNSDGNYAVKKFYEGDSVIINF